jgi:hypothetical protein
MIVAIVSSQNTPFDSAARRSRRMTMNTTASSTRSKTSVSRSVNHISPRPPPTSISPSFRATVCGTSIAATPAPIRAPRDFGMTKSFATRRASSCISSAVGLR